MGRGIVISEVDQSFIRRNEEAVSFYTRQAG